MEEQENKKKNILVVDDDDACQLIVELYLENVGCHIVMADNGEEAVNKAKLEKFDLIFMDLRMPIMDGYAASQAIRAIDKEVPIIALTANAALGVKEKCMECGMNDYLTKPFEEQDLIEMFLKWAGDNT